VVVPTATIGTFVSLPATVRELPIETPVTESTKMLVAPIATVCPVVVNVVEIATCAVRTELGEVNANATLFVI
jgi:hypothetical protein